MTYGDVTEHIKERVITDAEGWGDFSCMALEKSQCGYPSPEAWGKCPCSEVQY